MKKLCCGFLAFLLLRFSVLAEESSLSAPSTLELRQQLVSTQEALASSVSGNLRDVSYRFCEILGENGLIAMPLPGEAAGGKPVFPRRFLCVFGLYLRFKINLSGCQRRL